MIVNLKDNKGNELTQEYEVTFKKVKNITIRFNEKNILMVTSPRFLSERKLEKELQSMSDWIIKNRKKNETKNVYKLAKELTTEDDEYYFYGVRFNLEFINDEELFNKKIEKDEEYKQFGNIAINEYDKNIIILSNTKKWTKDFSKFEQDVFFNKIKFYFSKEINEMKEYNLPVSKIKVKTLKSAWGVCQTAKKEITLNRRLVNHREDCMRYVVIHELAHLVHANHSKEFYSVIEKVMPEYKKIRKELNYD